MTPRTRAYNAAYDLIVESQNQPVNMRALCNAIETAQLEALAEYQSAIIDQIDQMIANISCGDYDGIIARMHARQFRYLIEKAPLYKITPALIDSGAT
jgi:hypothetical protein